jgi:NADPH-dependent 2,4-dienoyl-CoA reductase/sulfur reductase-like enzyme
MVCGEDERPYNRPPLTKEFLAGKTEPEDLVLAEDLDAAWRLGTTAVSLDADRRLLGLDDGNVLAYDGLVIATGVEAVRLPGQSKLAGVYSIRTAAEATAFRDAAALARRLVVIGGGVLGCEAAATLAGSGAEITIVDRESQLVAPLGPDVGAYLKDLHSANGVRVHLGADISGFEGGRTVTGVRLADGTVLAADVVLVAVGGRPNVAWLAGSGIEHDLRRGVIVDERLRAPSHPEVVAVGDVAEFDSGRFGRRRLEHWSHAAESAEVAADNLIGDLLVPYQPVPTIWTDQYGVRIQTAGFLDQAVSMKRVLDDAVTAQWLLEGYDEQGRLVAAVGPNAARQMLRRQVQLAASLWSVES